MNPSGIRDNHHRGNTGEFLKEKIRSGSKLSFVSAYFTIYAHHALREELGSIDQLRFLFGEPRFIQSLDPKKTDKKAFDIEDSRLQLANRLEQRRIAADCADWIRRLVEIRSVKYPGFLHGKMYHVDNGGVQEALLGSSNFTVGGLGLGNGGRNNIELNLVVNDDRDRRDLLASGATYSNNTEGRMISKQPWKAAPFDKIPIRKPQPGEAEIFGKLVAMVQAAKKVDHASRWMESKRDACATFLEELIDACVLELYFPDECAAKDLRFITDTAVCLEKTIGLESETAIREFIGHCTARGLGKKLNRLEAASPDLFFIIKKEGKV